MDTQHQVTDPGIAFGAKKSPIALKQNTLSDPKAVLIAYLHRRIPRTNQGQLAGLLRPDLLNAHETPQDYAHVSAFPEEAFVEFNFDEGFPALPSGAPIWHKLTYETPELFAAFQLFLELVQEGPRHVACLLDSAELQMMLGDNLNLDFLRNVYHMYYWKDRAKAYDTFQEAAYRHIRVQRALKTEDHAYIQSSAMLQEVELIFKNPKLWENIGQDPKLALDYFKELLKIQRISAGLPASAPMGNDVTSSTFEMIMRKVQEETKMAAVDVDGAGAVTVDPSGRIVQKDGDFLKSVLGDPMAAKSMQEVIIRMTQQGGATKQPRWAGRVDHGGDGGDALPDGLSEGDLPGE